MQGWRELLKGWANLQSSSVVCKGGGSYWKLGGGAYLIYKAEIKTHDSELRGQEEAAVRDE